MRGELAIKRLLYDRGEDRKRRGESASINGVTISQGSESAVRQSCMPAGILLNLLTVGASCPYHCSWSYSISIRWASARVGAFTIAFAGSVRRGFSVRQTASSYIPSMWALGHPLVPRQDGSATDEFAKMRSPEKPRGHREFRRFVWRLIMPVPTLGSVGVSRRTVLKAAAAAASAGAALGLPSIAATTARSNVRFEPTLVGAIRWDAWVGGDWHVGATVNRTLSPQEYQFRLPFYAQITVPDRMLVEQNFDAEVSGEAPSGWTVSSAAGTSVAVEDAMDHPGKNVHLHDESETSPASMTHAFASQSRAVTVKWDWKETVAGRWGRALLIGGSTAVVDIATTTDAAGKHLVMRSPDGTWKVLQDITDDTWYSLKVIADPAPPQASPWVDVYVNGTRRISKAPLLASTRRFDNLTLRTNETLTSDLYVDNVSVAITESVNANGATQAIMDQEIQYAVSAGIDYWAFVYYPQEPLSRARNLYLSSAHRNDVNWCALLDGNFTGAFDANLAILAPHFAEPNYQKVLGGRPLLYFLTGADAAKVAKVRTKAAELGVPNPYIVVMAWTAESAATLKATVGADAVSRYATGGGNGATYDSVAATETELWTDYASAAGEVVPTVSTGWDNRPRYDYPVSWIGDYTSLQNNWEQQATPGEIATHLAGAIRWGNTHPTVTPANTVLIYAWNEFDEGGWICPTLHELRDSARPLRLDAIAGVSRTGLAKPR